MRFAPRNLDQAVAILDVEHVRTVRAVDGDAAPTRDESYDRIARGGFAALGQVAEHAFQSHDGDGIRRGGRDLPGEADQIGFNFGFLLLFCKAEDVDDAPGAQVAAADGEEEIIRVGIAHLVGEIFEVGGGHAQTAQLPVQDALALADIQVTVLDFEPVADLGFGALGGYQPQVWVEPIPAGAAVFGGDDFDLVAGFKSVIERDEFTVDLGAPAAISDIGVDLVGEIEGSGTGRHADRVALGREDENTLREDVALDAFDEFLGVFDILAPFHQGTQVLDHIVELFVGGSPFFVTPVGGDAVLGFGVHFEGANLKLDRLAVVIDDRGVQRAVVVALGRGDVIVEFAGDRAPVGVDDAQDRVTVHFIFHQQAYAADIREQFEGQAFAGHFVVNRVDVLRPPGDLGFDAGFPDHLADAPDDAFHLLLTRPALARQGAGDLFFFVRLQEMEGQVFEFPFHLPDTQAVGERGEDIHGLLGDTALLLRIQILERAHVVQAVGQFDHDHFGLFGHGQEGLAQGFGLEVVLAVACQLGGSRVRVGHAAPLGDLALLLVEDFFLGGLVAALDARQGGEFGNPVHEFGDVIAEVLAHVVERETGVLDRVVQQAGHDDVGRGGEFLGEDIGDCQAVRDVGFAGGARLALMRLFRDLVGLEDQFAVRGGVDIGQFFDEIVDLHHDRYILSLNAGWKKFEKNFVEYSGPIYRSIVKIPKKIMVIIYLTHNIGYISKFF